MSLEEVTADSPLKIGEFARDMPPQKFYNLNRKSFDRVPDHARLRRLSIPWTVRIDG